MASGWHRRGNPHLAAQRKRDYNSTAYKQRRAADKRTVDAGHAHCWRCGQWIDPTRPWHEGHDDHNRYVIRGPEHVSCNMAGAARKRNKATAPTRSQGAPQPRRWAL